MLHHLRKDNYANAQMIIQKIILKQGRFYMQNAPILTGICFNIRNTPFLI